MIRAAPTCAQSGRICPKRESNTPEIIEFRAENRRTWCNQSSCSSRGEGTCLAHSCQKLHLHQRRRRSGMSLFMPLKFLLRGSSKSTSRKHYFVWEYFARPSCLSRSLPAAPFRMRALLRCDSAPWETMTHRRVSYTRGLVGFRRNCTFCGPLPHPVLDRKDRLLPLQLVDLDPRCKRILDL